MGRKLSADEKAFTTGWTCDLCLDRIDLFNEATAGREPDDERRISRHAFCHYLDKQGYA